MFPVIAVILPRALVILERAFNVPVDTWVVYTGVVTPIAVLVRKVTSPIVQVPIPVIGNAAEESITTFDTVAVLLTVSQR